jgi:hypothetical protein
MHAHACTHARTHPRIRTAFAQEARALKQLQVERQRYLLNLDPGTWEQLAEEVFCLVFFLVTQPVFLSFTVFSQP